MRQLSLTSLLITLLLFAVCGTVCLGQAPEGTNVSQNEPAAETDQLPFMQHDQAAEYQEPGSGSLVLKTLGSLLVIVGLIFVGAWAAKKLGFGGTGSSQAAGKIELAMLSSLSLGSGRTIATVQFGSRVLLIGSTAQSFTLLAEDEGDNDNVEPHKARSVAEMLAEENGSFDTEFDLAQNKLDAWENTGESI